LPSGGQDGWRHAILPIATMAVGGIGLLARFSRSAMIEVLDQPHIRTAMAKGLSWRAVVWRHALPNAAVPIVTLIGFMLGSLIAGAVVIESIFSWPGIGRLIVGSVGNRDLAVVQCLLLVIASPRCAANLLVGFPWGRLARRLRSRRARHRGARDGRHEPAPAPPAQAPPRPWAADPAAPQRPGADLVLGRLDR